MSSRAAGCLKRHFLPCGPETRITRSIGVFDVLRVPSRIRRTRYESMSMTGHAVASAGIRDPVVIPHLRVASVKSIPSARRFFRVRSQIGVPPGNPIERHRSATSYCLCRLCPKDGRQTHMWRWYRLHRSAVILWRKMGLFHAHQAYVCERLPPSKFEELVCADESLKPVGGANGFESMAVDQGFTE